MAPDSFDDDGFEDEFTDATGADEHSNRFVVVAGSIRIDGCIVVRRIPTEAEKIRPAAPNSDASRGS